MDSSCSFATRSEVVALSVHEGGLLRGSVEDAETLNAPGDYLVSLGLGTACREDKNDEKILPKHAKAPRRTPFGFSKRSPFEPQRKRIAR